MYIPFQSHFFSIRMVLPFSLILDFSEWSGKISLSNHGNIDPFVRVCFIKWGRKPMTDLLEGPVIFLFHASHQETINFVSAAKIIRVNIPAIRILGKGTKV